MSYLWCTEVSRGVTDLLTFAEVAECLRISRRQVERYVSQGRLRSVRLSPRVSRIRATELQAFLAASERRLSA